MCGSLLKLVGLAGRKCGMWMGAVIWGAVEVRLLLRRHRRAGQEGD